MSQMRFGLEIDQVSINLEEKINFGNVFFRIIKSRCHPFRFVDENKNSEIDVPTDLLGITFFSPRVWLFEFGTLAIKANPNYI